MKKDKCVFAFDLGTGSVGEAVRIGSEIKHIDSLLLPSDFASTKKEAIRRRQYRTRLAHKARENWWQEQARIAGLEVLESRQPSKGNPAITPEPRLLREFPEEGDTTIYTSCLLRIALLQGVKLESWQVYKAIRSAIQHRGYDPELPWKRQAKRNVDEDESGTQTGTDAADEKNDEAENKSGVERYELYLKTNFEKNPNYHYPCYYEAHRMGIWDSQRPAELNGKIGYNPAPARNKDGRTEIAVAPRRLVEKEIRDLLTQAAQFYPKLSGKTEYILYGPSEKAYASYVDKRFVQHRGKKWEWQGLLGQKIPRFDNRIIAKCALIPRLNVCKADDKLNQDVTFLMKLKNMRYFQTPGYQECPLDAKNIQEIYELFKTTKRITKSKWKKYVKEHLNGIPNPTQIEVEAPKIGGRSRFCRPTLGILKEILLSGISPHKKHEELTRQNTNSDPRKGLINDDYHFLLDMPSEWSHFHVPDSRIRDEKLDSAQRKQEIENAINKISNPVVRHRLRLFKSRLQSLEAKFGAPDKLVIELVRDPDEGFMGKKRKASFIKSQKENKARKDAAFKDVQEYGQSGRTALTKMDLLREQGGIDFYSLETLEPGKLDQYEIDHIVPRGVGGPDAMINKILTIRANNQEKGNRTPFEWLSSTGKWPGILQKIEKSHLSKKKKELLASPNARELVGKYTHLAETAYMAKLAQRLASLYFGWPQQTEGSERKIIVANGSFTAKLRRRFRLDSLLHTGLDETKFKELAQSGGLDKKNRENPRHHALDALVISMIPEIKFNPSAKEDELPDWFHKEFCRNALAKVQPRHIYHERAKLAETIYGLRQVQEKGKAKSFYAVTRFGTGTAIGDLLDMAKAKKYVDGIFDKKIREDFKEMIEKNPSQQDWKNFIENYQNGGKPRKIAQKDSGGMSPDEVDLGSGLAGEYKSMGKIPGQYYKDKKEHQGSLVYQDDKGRWRSEPVYAFDSRHEKIKAARAAHRQEYFFRSQDQVEIRTDCNMQNPNQQIPKGIYFLRTIIQSGRVKLATMDGAKTPVASLNTVMNEGRMRLRE
ncbi:MAG: type II CRISPR RNA-guided endonuclease Cas9d [Elusimicrobiota bacterium]